MKPSVQIYAEVFDRVTKNGTLERGKLINGVGESVHSTHMITFHNQPVTFKADTALSTITERGFARAVITTHTLSALANGQWRKLYTRTLTMSTYDLASQADPKPEVVEEVFTTQEKLLQLLRIEQESINMKLEQTIKAQEKKIAKLEDKLLQILKIVG
jgi:hypothetical protein